MRYREEMRSGRTLERSTVNTVGSVGVALLLATITTMIAFLSYVASPISLLAEFGILCAVGIFGAFFSMTTFVPAAKLIRDRRKARKGKPLFTTFRYNEKRAKRLEARERSGKKGKAGKGESGEKGMAGKGGSGKEGKKEKAGKGKEGGKAKNKKNSPSCADDNNNADGGMKKGGVGVKALNRGLCAGATAAERYPATTLIVVLAITLASGYAAYNLDTEFNFEDFLPEDLPISRDIDFLMNEFELAGGEASEVYILVKGDLTSPEVLRAMGETVDNMADDRYVLQKDGAADVDTILTFMAGVASPPETSSDIFSPFDPAFAALYQGTMGPDTLPLETAAADDVSGLYDWLFDNKPKDVKRYLHLDGSGGGYDGSVMRISVMDLDMNAEKITELEDDLNSDKEPLDDADGVDEVVVTGGEILTNIVMTAMNESQLRSMIITIIMTALILSIVFFSSYRSLGLGVITTVPVVLCIFWILGSMYIVGLSLNMMTITLASLTVGLGATYAIHITHRFMEELELGKDPDEAARVTVTHTGSALFGAMATTVAGFGILVFSLLPPMQQFGGIAAIAILFAFLSCAFVLPTMLVLWAKWNVRRGRTWEKH
jgi:predicted RND superfamily exporter protein